MPPEQEAQLVRRVMEGDRSALGPILEHYQHRLFNVALRMVGNRDDAAEVAQEAMLKIVQNVDGYNGKAAISTWMIRITMNLSISHLRKRRLRQTASLDAEYPGKGNGDGGGGRGDAMSALRHQLVQEHEPEPGECVQQREMIAHLQNAMTRLDDDFQAVLVLRDINEMDYQEIAQALEIPVGTVKSRLFRARLALRQEMYKIYPQAEQENTRRSPARGATGTPGASGSPGSSRGRSAREVADG
jgi:RNA polymerase sigma-70 factor, ECF subfamily